MIHTSAHDRGTVVNVFAEVTTSRHSTLATGPQPTSRTLYRGAGGAQGDGKRTRKPNPALGTHDIQPPTIIRESTNTTKYPPKQTPTNQPSPASNSTSTSTST